MDAEYVLSLLGLPQLDSMSAFRLYLPHSAGNRCARSRLEKLQNEAHSDPRCGQEEHAALVDIGARGCDQ